nr:beta-1,4-endoglucanase [uncultured bacterium]
MMKMDAFAHLLSAAQASTACECLFPRPIYYEYVSAESRVIDFPSDARFYTTSEGQSIARLFQALAPTDRDGFRKLFQWTQHTLAEGDLPYHLPGPLWDTKSDHQWTVLDNNAPSHSDLFFSWALLEAGRLWDTPQYTEGGKAPRRSIVEAEVPTVPGLGPLVLPGKVGSVEDGGWRLYPGLQKPQSGAFGAPKIRDNNLRLLLETAPGGFSPDWVRYQKGRGWQLRADAPIIGSGDAMRVYHSTGMPSSPMQKAPRWARIIGYRVCSIKQGLPPEPKTSGERLARGRIRRGPPCCHSPETTTPYSYSATFLVADRYPDAVAYYRPVPTLFGQKWDQHRPRNAAGGELQPHWNHTCARSH